MTFIRVQKFNNGKPIIFGLNRIATPYSVVAKDSVVLPNADSLKLVTEGSFVAQVGNEVRFLPRTRVKGTSGAGNINGTATNSAQLTLKAPSFSFKVGDVLYPQGCYGELVFAGTFTAGDVYTVRVGTANYSITAPASPTAATVAALFVSTHATALLAAGVMATQRGSSGSVSLFGTDSYPVATASSSGSVSITLNTTDTGYLGDSILPLGTILSIGPASASGERVITLVANAAYVIPANAILGVAIDKHLGIYPEPLDLTAEPIQHIAPIAECDGVYEQNLPYVDEQLKRIHTQLYINKRFYKVV